MKFILSLLLLIQFAHSSGTNPRFDHTHKKLDRILKKYVIFKTRQSLVNYAQLKENKNDLEDYLENLSLVSKKQYKAFSKKRQLAFLINAYNGFTLKLIIDNYPTKSIRDLGNIVFNSPWKKEFFQLFGEDFYLDRIEHKMIRVDFDEPRIHFAVNCASIGCPSLLNEAFVATRLNEQLDRGAVNFLLNKDKNKLDKDTLYVSKIFEWYGDDFNKKYGSYQNYVKKILGLKGDYKIKFLDYDWGLNELK